jgi:amino acid transporter
MTQICGIGPFVTIPAIVAAVGGPMAILGWIVGATIVMADGLVWAELGAAMPGAGGTYLYLREAFQYTTGRMMPFLFIWTVLLSIPLIMSTGVIGMVQYMEYYFPKMTPLTIHLVSASVMVLVVGMLYQRLTVIAKITEILWVIMIVTVGGVILASFTHFNPKMAFVVAPGTFRLNSKFFSGLGAALIFSVYDYLGYNTTAYMAEEVRDPGRVLPRSIIYSILAMLVIYLSMNIGILGVLPTDQIANSNFIGADVMEHIWGKTAAQVFTGLIIITAFASVVTGLLGGSRVPYHAAKDKLFFSVFGRLHPRLNFPHIALLVMGVVTLIGSFFTLTDVITMLTAATVLIQGVAQVIALTVLRRRQPNLPRPYRMFLYPLPSLIALAGWIYLYFASGWEMIWLSLAWMALGVGAFLIWAKVEKTWPFGEKEIRQAYLTPAADGAE